MPVTDEKAPKEKDFALLMRRLWKPPEGAALIFNCQMGRGRTSTGMIIASLLHLRRRVSSVAMPTEPQGELIPLLCGGAWGAIGWVLVGGRLGQVEEHLWSKLSSSSG